MLTLLCGASAALAQAPASPSTPSATSETPCVVILFQGHRYTLGCDASHPVVVEPLAPPVDAEVAEASPPVAPATDELPAAPEVPPYSAPEAPPFVVPPLPATPAPPTPEAPIPPWTPDREAPAGDVTPSAPMDDPVPGPCDEPEARGVIALANAARAEEGLPPLACDEALSLAAGAHSADMCDAGFFDHRGSDGSSPARRALAFGAERGGVGENIAAGYPGPAEAHAGWMRSPGHRDNILSPSYERVGVGYEACGGRRLWTQLFSD